MNKFFLNASLFGLGLAKAVLVCAQNHSPYPSYNGTRTENEGVQFINQWAGAKSRQLLEAIHFRRENYEIVDVCQGSFSRAGPREFAVALVNSELKIGMYLGVVLDQDRYEPFELSRFPVQINKEGKIIGRPIEVACKGWTELERIKVDYSQRLGESRAFSNLKTHGKLDFVCVVPPRSDAEFICYEYRQDGKKFNEVGGWFND
jgi:hypothetical protein